MSNPTYECKSGIDIESIYVFDPKDCVFDKHGVFVRLKRKYGKFLRPIYKLNKNK